MIFRQEIYNQFEYQKPLEYFMTFEGDVSYSNTLKSANAF